VYVRILVSAYTQKGHRRRIEDIIQVDLVCHKDVVWVCSVQVEIRVKAAVEG
jgi:hypothetical protein